MRTNVYVDGFNLYHGALKGSSHRWLDLGRLFQLLLPHNQVQRIKYFTAHVNARPNNPDQPIRQQTYLRALRTIPNLEVILGHFLVSRCRMLEAGSPPHAPRYVEVVKTEEKGSDVNIATHMLWDGFRNDYELAVLVTNDSDLVEPVRLVRQELGLAVGILNPHRHPSRTLLRYCSFMKQIRAGVLASSQFPPILTDAIGTFSKPASW